MLVDVIKKFLKENNISKETYLVLGLSGGVDSMTLFDCLYKLNYKIIIAHVNHHKRLESEKEMDYIKNLAKKLDVPFELLNYYDDHSDNFHNLAHHARYDFFKKCADKYKTKYIITAHHADDQIETVLIKMMEGSNLYGYGGISKINDDGNYKIIRPLLTIPKNELYDYANKNNIIYFEDSSNSENHYLRNRIRHNIIPIIKNECPDIYNKIDEYSIQIKEAFEYIRNEAINYLKTNDNKINLETYSKLNIALKKDIICLLLEYNYIRKNNNIILNIYNLLESNLGSKEIKLENDYYFFRKYNLAYIAKKEIKREEKEYILNIDNVVFFNNKYKVYFSKNIPINNAKYIKLCYNNIELPFKIRTKKEGDVILLINGSKKISRILIDNKVPKEERNNVPIILDNKDNILWVYDYAKSKQVFEDKLKGDIFLILEGMN